MHVVEKFSEILSFSYDNVFLTMDWNKCKNETFRYCQWDQLFILPKYNEKYQLFEKITEIPFWNKICIESQAYIHYVPKQTGYNIIIQKRTLIIIVIIICILVLLIIVSLFFIAKFNNKCQSCCFKVNKHDSSDENTDSVENLHSEELKGKENEEKKENFFLCFITELFDIGNSSGSLISEAIGLFRTFQKLSATKTFSIHFSKDCLKLFSWATNIFEIVLSNFYFRVFSDIELFYVINFVIPLLLITFIILIDCVYQFYLILVALIIPFSVLGFGFAYIKYDHKISIYILIPSSIICICILILFISTLCSCFSFCEYMKLEPKFDLPLSFAIFNILAITFVCLFPFFYNNSYFVGSYIFICLIIIIISLIIEMIIRKLKTFDDLREYYLEKLSLFFWNFLTLLFIPSTNYLVKLMLSEYKNNWNCIVGFIVFSILPPFIITSLFLMDEDSGIFHKYKEWGYWYFEYVDIIRQMAYGFVSAYDIPWACIGIEVAWILLVLVFRIYKTPSQYTLQAGSSLIVIISNSIAIACEYQKKDFLSFCSSITLVCVACIPAILSLYLFFLFEFGKKDDYRTETFSDSISAVFLLFTPFAWLFFGMFIPIMLDSIKNNKIHKIE